MNSRQILQLKGVAHIVGDDINTDYIIASRYKARADDLAGLTKHVFEDLDPDLAGRITQGDLILAGDNFGSGSSRETAPRVLLAAGISAVVARSFARIFFRNAINVGLPVIECQWHSIENMDIVSLDVSSGELKGAEQELLGTFTPLPGFLMEILEAGGVREILKRRG